MDYFIIFMLMWIASSLIFKKYTLDRKEKYLQTIAPIIYGNIFILALTTSLIIILEVTGFSRMILFGTYGLTFILELVFTFFYWNSTRIIISGDFNEKLSARKEKFAQEKKIVDKEEEVSKPSFDPVYKNLIISEQGQEVFDFISKNINIDKKTLLISTTTIFNILKQPDNQYESVINLKSINDIIRINKFFEGVNKKLPYNGLFCCSAETYMLRKKRILSKYPPVINYLFYIIDFTYKRAFPKIWGLKKVYFFLTQGRNRVISMAETFGRLYSCGFEIVDEAFIDNKLFFVVKKIKEPSFPEKPTYGPLIRLRRYGKGGKIINVYKMRTMHAYSEYLQEYIYSKFDLQEGGKFKNDFRITTLGKFMRKVWLDELPMLLNLLKGEMKIVGVRPLSTHYFNLYSKELQEKRIKFKPGLIPPFYADMPKTLEDIMASEMKYLESYEKRPLLTDIRYFWYAFRNIIFKKARSN
jgi:lipopolysaccharide/colanic/teichoic acid biosynthesis glycosyltransferase